MKKDDQVQLLKKDVKAWNNWRRMHPGIKPDFTNVNLTWAYLNGANLDEVNFWGANLSATQLVKASLKKANIRHAQLHKANFTQANLSEAHLNYSSAPEAIFIKANLMQAHFDFCKLESTNFQGANLVGADLSQAHFFKSNLINANLSKARVSYATFSDVDLSKTKGLLSTKHFGPSTVGIDTLYRSKGRISEKFLKRCGVPSELITYLPSLIAAEQKIKFHSCFISYSHKNVKFAELLYSRMQKANLRVWFAPKDIKGGEKIHEEIYNAIQLYDKLLLVISKESMESEWVKTEIRKAMKVEGEQKSRKLFPISLVDYETIKKWEYFDADSGKDLAVELRKYFIPDFSKWKDVNSFNKTFNKLLLDIKQTVS